MADTVVAPAGPEIKPSQPPPLAPDELFPATKNPFSNPNFEKIESAASGVFDKFKIPFIKGRGRPRKDGQPGKADVPLGVQPAAVPVVASPPANAGGDLLAAKSRSLLSRSVVSVVKGSLAFLKSIVGKKAWQAKIDPEFTSKALAECSPDEEAFRDFSESLELVLEKYNANTEYAPEIALAASTVRIYSPFLLLFKKFDMEIERQKSREIKPSSPK